MPYECSLKLVNKSGLHARPASRFVQHANNFNAEISVEYNGKMVNAKSIMSILSLGAGHGAKIKIKAEGDDEEKAVLELAQLLQGAIDEER